MAANGNLHSAKRAKNDEFYTQWRDIELEMTEYYEYDHDTFRDKVVLCPCDDPEWSEFTRFFATNFERFGLRKLICTSYARGAANRQPTLFERESGLFDRDKTETHGKMFVVDGDRNLDGHVDVRDIGFTTYLEGDGDFRSPEVTALRDEADIVVTNPPFSLFREFVAWVMDGGKRFSIIGNQNAITYKEVFPLLMEDRVWLGYGFSRGNAFFRLPDDASGDDYAKGVFDPETRTVKFRNCCWFTNLEHGKRHEPMMLDTARHNLKFNKRLVRSLGLEDVPADEREYPRYDNYDAIEVPVTIAIPSDWDGAMGVPITFLGSYNPDQFEILGASFELAEPVTIDNKIKNNPQRFYVGGKRKYERLVIRRRSGGAS